MRFLGKTVSLVLLGVAALATVQADFRELDIRTEGRGSVRTSGGRTELTSVRIRLMRDGHFELTTSNNAYRYEGGWRNSSRDNTVELFVREGRGGSMEGSGTLVVGPNRSIRSLELNGDRQNDLALTFRGGRRDDNNDNDDRWERNVSIAQRGDGTFRFRDRNRDLNKATIDLDTDGRFSLRFNGEKDYVFTGRYTRRGNNVTLDINGSPTLEGADGRGRVQLSGRNRISSISLNGRHERRAFDIDFRGNR